MAFGAKTNERPGVRAELHYARFSAYKAREVLNLIRGKTVAEARGILQFTERACSVPIQKCLDSAVANAGNNNDIPPDELFVSACFADEGPTLKRFRPRARGRAGRIRKRTCHVTIIVSRMSSEQLDQERAKSSRRSAPATSAAARSRRVSRSRASSAAPVAEATATDVDEPTGTDDAATEPVVEEAAGESTADGSAAEAELAVDDSAVDDEDTDDPAGDDASATDEPEKES